MIRGREGVWSWRRGRVVGDFRGLLGKRRPGGEEGISFGHGSNRAYEEEGKGRVYRFNRETKSRADDDEMDLTSQARNLSWV